MSIFISSPEDSVAEENVVVQIKDERCRVEVLIYDGLLTVNVYPGHVGKGENVDEHPLAIYESSEGIEPTLYRYSKELHTWRVRTVDSDVARKIRDMAPK